MYLNLELLTWALNEAVLIVIFFIEEATWLLLIVFQKFLVVPNNQTEQSILHSLE
jgi:hypothetical protein